MSSISRAEVLTQLMLEIFRANGALLSSGDRLVEGIGLTSARWQMLGALAIGGGSLNAPQAAKAMGVTRQGALKQLNILVKEGLVEAVANPRNVRSPLYRLTKRGDRTYSEARRLNAGWSERLGHEFSLQELRDGLGSLQHLRELLERDLAVRATEEDA